MRLLLLFLLPLLSFAADVLDLPVDKKTDDTEITVSDANGIALPAQCRVYSYKSIKDPTKKTEAKCSLDLSKRFAVRKSNTGNKPQFKALGFCNKGVFYCEYNDDPNSNEICKGGVNLMTQTIVDDLKEKHAIFTDSSTCQLVVNDHTEAITIHNRFKQDYFEEFKKDTSTQASLPLYVASVANYMISEVDLPRTKLEIQDNMIFGGTFTWSGNGHNPCGDGCAYGAYLSYTQVVTNKLFSIELYPSQKCEWIAVCFKFNDKCHERDRMMFLLKQDIFLPHESNSAISLPLHNAKSIRMERPKSDEEKFYVTTDNSDRVVLKAINTDKFAIMMSHHDCLAAPPYTNLGDGEVYRIETDTFDADGVNRQNPNTMVKDQQKLKDFNDAHKKSGTDHKDKLADGAKDNGNATKHVDEIQESTTAKTTVLDGDVSKTDAPTLPSINIGDASMSKSRPQTTSTDDEKNNKTGWRTWGYVWGSLAGSTTGFLICGIFFYLCRRSIYQNWYRGVYKRYGCDASGTTGGATGADFGTTTGGGRTTIGAETAGASTMGTTGGSTSSAMSTVDDKTGTSMITM